MIDWTPKIPPWESQYSATTHTDAQDCVAESFCHIVYMLTGRRYSPRALALMSGTTEAGNDVNDVLEAANTKGLIPYELWPTPDSFTWDSYYASIPASILVQAEKLDITLIPPDLDKSPLWTELEWGANLPVPTRHMVAQINTTQYFDSEIGAPVKPLDYEGAIIAYQTSITINKPPMQFFQVTGESTIVALIGGLYRELATPPELFAYCQKALGIPASLPAVDRATVNAAIGKQIVAGITF